MVLHMLSAILIFDRNKNEAVKTEVQWIVLLFNNIVIVQLRKVFEIPFQKLSDNNSTKH